MSKPRDSQGAMISIPAEWVERLFALLQAGLDAQEQQSDLLRPAAVAKKLGTSRGTVYKLVEAGKLPSVRFSTGSDRHVTRIRPADLRAFIERCAHDEES